MNITDSILVENRFELKNDVRWYYGPYIYLVKCRFPETYWDLYVDKDKCIDWVGNKICSFDERYEDIDKIRAICKEFYMDLNKKYKIEIEKIESKREEIMNYVF